MQLQDAVIDASLVQRGTLNVVHDVQGLRPKCQVMHKAYLLV